METIQAPISVQALDDRVSGEEKPVRTASRMVVVVPDVAEPAMLAGSIHEAARSLNREVLLLGVTSRQVPESDLRRRLTLLAAFLRDAGTAAQIRVEDGREWVTRFRALLEDDDLLACCIVASLPGEGERWMELMAREFKRPVRAFMDSGEVQSPGPGFFNRAAPWLISMIVIGAFFWLQARLSQQGGTGASMAWLGTSVFVEVGLLWLLNGLLG